MTLLRYSFISLFSFLLLPGCKKNEPVNPSLTLQLSSINVGTTSISLSGTPSTGLPIDETIALVFSAPVDITSVSSSVSLLNGTQPVAVDFSFQDSNRKITLLPKQPLSNKTTYTISISNQVKGGAGEVFPGLRVSFVTVEGQITLVSYKIGGKTITSNRDFLDTPLTLDIELDFSLALDPSTVTSQTVSLTGPNPSTLAFAFSNGNQTLTITRPTPLTYLKKYTLNLANTISGVGGTANFTGLSSVFYTSVGNHTSGLPAQTDDQLLTLVEQQTFKYFYDFGHPNSGMARERNTSGNTVTTGGSGFGLMSMIVGVERGFITRDEGIARINKVIGFLETADRFHGAWPHWIDGNTGHVIPFSSNDDGADLVETSFMAQALLTVRQYLTQSDTIGNNLINRINTLWYGIEWDWFRRCEPTCQNVIYWHWSPDKGWVMNFPLYGYFEEQITYFMAAASPTHSIPKIVYSNGFGMNGSIKTGNTYTYAGESYVLPLGSPAPLFWTQYSYLGLDPHFTDDYADYWQQNTNASLINHAYCKANPGVYAGYSDSCWGITASDNPSGYGAQSVGNDNGTITPTAALSAFPYTPVESMKALRFFYDILGDRVWGTYGFYDAFNITEDWYADSFLAIDQGPIIVMIENSRTGLLWNLFMSAPEVPAAKTTLGFN